jgi:hypothetical protein
MQYTDGSERAGRILFEDGHALLRTAYESAINSGSARNIALAELSIIEQELRDGGSDEKEAMSSGKAAKRAWDDAFLALSAVEQGPAYKIADQIFPHDGDYRYKDMPHDAFHIACKSHITRLKNGMSRFGVPALDRDLVKVRINAIKAIQEIYYTLQKTAMV